nr:LppA family lipoprotein [Mycobacterium sp.]
MLDHDVRFYGPTGISIGVGYRGNLVVSGSTGCRLPRERK